MEEEQSELSEPDGSVCFCRTLGQLSFIPGVGAVRGGVGYLGMRCVWGGHVPSVCSDRAFTNREL